MVMDTMSRHALVVFVWILIMFIRGVTASRNLYFDKTGDCWAEDAYQLDKREYFVKSTGGDFVYQNTLCDLAFEAANDLGICLTFEECLIEDCDVTLNIYQSLEPESPPWRSFSCNNGCPSQLCSNNRYLTLEVKKKRMNFNQGYAFFIKVEESDMMSGEGALFASIGIVIAIIVGVVVVCCLLTLVFYCCCKRRRAMQKEMEEQSMAPQENLVAPSAPPVEAAYDYYRPRGASPYNKSQAPPYQYGQNMPMNDPRTPIAHQMDPPPPYGPPPPYDE